MTKGNRISVSKLAERLCQYDVISFDVFGTLILRPFSSPRVLFSIMEERLGIYKFAKIRLDSEDEARLQKLNSDDGRDNVTLLEIYQLIARKTNLDANLTAKLEYDLEVEFCYANPYFKEVVSKCKEAHKTVIVCSDMYLSRQQIQGILRKAGYPDFDGVYVSSELNRSKKQGDVFTILKRAYPEQRIIHVGDDKTVDMVRAEQSGIDAYYYENVNTIGGKNRIKGMSYLAGRIYSGLVNNHFYCDGKPYSDEYKLGYVYGGIYVLGFVHWVNRFVQDHDIGKVLFLARDGDIYSRIYDMLPNHGEWQYFYWSRMAGIKVTAIENFYEFCQRMIWHKARGVYRIQVGHVLQFFGISYLVPRLATYRLMEGDILSDENAERVERLFYDNKEAIVDTFREDVEITLDNIRNAVGEEKKIAIVDVGWAGTGPMIIKKAIRHYLRLNCQVYSLLAGYRQPSESMASLYTMDDTNAVYLFSANSNRDLLGLHVEGTKKSNLLLEIFTQSCSPSFLGYTREGLEFDREESENYAIIRNISQGVLDFASEYIHAFRGTPFLLNISAYDAYLPFNDLKNSDDLLNPILSKMTIARGKFYDADSRSTETLLSFLDRDESGK